MAIERNQNETSIGTSSKSMEIITKFVLIISILFLQALRISNINETLVFRHSYGEAQYADWADGMRQYGLRWGFFNEGEFRQGFTTYIPIASYLNYILCPVKENCSPVTLGRSLSFILSLMLLIFLYQSLLNFKISKDIALFCLLLVTSTPLYGWHSMMFYNEPISLFILCFIFFIVSKTYLNNKQASLPLHNRILLFVLFIILGLLKPTNNVPFLFLIPFLFKNNIPKFFTQIILTAILSFFLVGLFFLSQRFLYPLTFAQGKDLWIFSERNIVEASAVVLKQFIFDFGFFSILGIVSIGSSFYFLLTYERSNEKAGVNNHFLVSFFLALTIGSMVVCISFLHGLRIHNYYTTIILIPFIFITAINMNIWQRIRILKWKLPLVNYKSVFILSLTFICLSISLRSYKSIFKGSGNYDINLAMMFASNMGKKTKSCFGFIGSEIAIHQYYLSYPCIIKRDHNFLSELEQNLMNSINTTYFHNKSNFQIPKSILEKIDKCQTTDFENYLVISCQYMK